MKTTAYVSPFRLYNPQRGSVIAMALMVIIVLSILGGGIIKYSLTSHYLAMHNNQLLVAQAVAESELENLYFTWQTHIKGGLSPEACATAISNEKLADYSPTAVNIFSAASTEHMPFAAAHRDGGWTVKRSFRFERTLTGQLPNTQKSGTISFFTVGVVVSNGATQVQLGRRFVMSDISLFQFAIFYQGDLELAPGSNMNIHGPISSNGAIYAGANNNQTLKFYDSVAFGSTFNGDPTGAKDKQMRNPMATPTGSSALKAPTFTSDAKQDTARAKQLGIMKEGNKENFLGGLDAVKIQNANPTLFTEVNDVYRSVVEPPPVNTSDDDPVIASRRMYNRAGLRITIKNDDSVDVVINGKKYDPSEQIYANAVGTLTNVHQPIYDQREKMTVNVTTMDVSKLVVALNNMPDIKKEFNGVIYINDETPSGSALRLINGDTLPSGKGLTMATNGALYVQGNYNTKTNNGQTIPAALIADTVTILSSGWADKNSTNDIKSRKASDNITITAGILTGNTPTSAGANSGGAQNLVRLMEDWNGRTITMTGSVGQLFTSKYFTAKFPTSLGTVYSLPSSRAINFDQVIAKTPPPGSPTTTQFSRGDLITTAY